MARAIGRRRREEEAAPAPDFTVITGLSGAGRSEAAKVFEDLGYFVIDNLPPALIGKMAELAATPGQSIQHVALVVDVRGGQFFTELEEALKELAERGFDYRILFLTSQEDALVRRYEATRRRHPLADRVVEGIARERELLEGMRAAADLVIDTTELTPHELRDRILSTFSRAPRESRLRVTVTSFGYKHGVPLDADIVMDVRFLPNPHWVDELRPLPGTDPRVRDYVMKQDATSTFLQKFEEMLGVLIPGYVAEGKHYLTIAIGCTGGHHRSVVIAEQVAELLRDRGLQIGVEHRDVERPL